MCIQNLFNSETNTAVFRVTAIFVFIVRDSVLVQLSTEPEEQKLAHFHSPPI